MQLGEPQLAVSCLISERTDHSRPIALGRGVADLFPAIDEACAAGVLVESGGGLGFRHPLIRAALYDEMPTSVRAAWHRDAGDYRAGD